MLITKNKIYQFYRNIVEMVKTRKNYRRKTIRGGVNPEISYGTSTPSKKQLLQEISDYIYGIYKYNTSELNSKPEHVKNRIVKLADLDNKLKQKYKMRVMVSQDKSLNSKAHLNMVQTLAEEIQVLEEAILYLYNHLEDPETKAEMNAKEFNKKPTSWWESLVPRAFMRPDPLLYGGKRRKNRTQRRKH